MKTIFITSFHQFISRNILQTPILAGLLKIPDLRVVIFAPSDKKEYFEEEFGGKGPIIECVPTSRGANGFWSLVFKRAARAMVSLRYKEVARGFKTNPYRDFLIDIFVNYPLRFFGRFSWAQTVLRFLNHQLIESKKFTPFFEKYAPDLVFSADAQNENDVLLATEAKKRRIPIVAMIRSWDNVEMYGTLRVVPDTLLVWGDFLKKEILRLNNIDPDRVKTVGVPHYDRYLAGPTMSREEFFTSLGADPKRKLILFTPVGDMYVKENDIDRLVLSELAKTGENILVRTPPADTVSLGDFHPPANVFFYHPGTAVDNVGRREISRADDDHLINSLHFSDVVVSGPSTIMLDAVLLNRPVVLFGFDGRERPYEESVLSLYNSQHLMAVTQKGAARLTKNVAEFKAALAEYLVDPTRDAAERRQAVEFICYKTDGQSCERVLKVLKSYLVRQ